MNNLVLDNSLLYSFTHYNSFVENYAVLNNSPLHDSALYKSVLDDSAIGNMVEINFSQAISPQAPVWEGFWYVWWGLAPGIKRRT